MRTVIAFLLILPLSACVAGDDLETAVHEVTVIEEPEPFIHVDGHRVVEPGYPLQIYHSWHGTCDRLWEYPCEFRDYTVEVSCSRPCELIDFVADGDGSGDAFWVVPLELGELTVGVTLRGPWSSSDAARLQVLEPTNLEIACVRGRLYPAERRQHCTDDLLLASWDGKDVNTDIHLLPVVLSNGIELQGLTDVVERSWPGGEGTLDPPTSLPATIHAVARYRDLETSITKFVVPPTRGGGDATAP